VSLLRQFLPPRVSLRTLTLAVPVAAALAFAAPAGAAEVAPTGVTAEIDMVFEKGKMKFVGPKSVTQGDTLRIVNSTSLKQTGPHTFSLVKPNTLPKTAAARQSCFAPKHICLSIAQWHKFNPKTGKVAEDLVKAGPAGWSTAGDNVKKGDSWYTEKKGETFEQQVSAAPGELSYICAIHPWMQGKVKVVAPTATPTS
jgi:plastocyanin